MVVFCSALLVLIVQYDDVCVRVCLVDRLQNESLFCFHANDATIRWHCLNFVYISSPGCYDALFILHVWVHVCVCLYARIADVSHVWLLIRNLFVRAIYDHPTVFFITNKISSCFLPPTIFFPLLFIICTLIINYFHPVSESTKRFCGWCFYCFIY